MAELKGQIEALLFSSGRPIPEEMLASILETDQKQVRKVLKQLHAEYAERDGALKIFEENHLWRMLVKDEFVDITSRIVADTELTRPVMETLAVVAYHYPKILQSDVIKTRGSHAYDHIKELMDAGFITRIKEGRSFAIKLTDKFFEYFDIEGADDIREFFKGINIPRVDERQKKLGDMDIVDVVPEDETRPQQKELLGDLEVVDEPNEPENPFMTRELGKKPVVTAEEAKRHQDFLDDIDAQIAVVREKNEAHDQDESFKFKLPKEEDGDPDEHSDGQVSDEDETVDDVIKEVRGMVVDEELGEDEKSALDEPLDLENL